MSSPHAASVYPSTTAITAFIRRHLLASYLIMAFTAMCIMHVPALVLDASRPPRPLGRRSRLPQQGPLPGAGRLAPAAAAGRHYPAAGRRLGLAR